MQPFSFRLPWQSSGRASPRPANESSSQGPEPTVQSPEIKPDQPPERSRTMSSSQSQKKAQAHSKPSPSHSHTKNQTRTTSKPPSPSKPTPRASAASKSPPLSSMASQSPAVAAAAPRSRIASTSASPSQTSNRNNLSSKPTSQPGLRGDSQPSSPSQAASTSRSPSQPASRQQRSRKTSRVQSPSHLSSKPTGQSTSQQHIASPAAIEDQTTSRITSRPANQPSSKQMQTKSKQSPKPNLKPVESKASKDHQPQTKEEITFTSKNTSNPHSNQNSLEDPTQTIKNGLEPSLESQAEAKESKEIESDNEDLAKTTNASTKSTLITSTESSSSFEPENGGSQQKDITEDDFRVCKKLNIKYPDEENPMAFISLVGDNKGASMHLVSGKAKRESSIHIHREYKRNKDEDPENSTDGEGNFKHKTLRDSRTEVDVPLRLCINNNVQGINSSILFKSSLTVRNPGIKTSFIREPSKSEDRSQSLHAQKAKYTARPAEKLTYQPIVRRRCLRGLVMESSDSELDNPEKPRRIGCSYSGCKGKDMEIL